MRRACSLLKITAAGAAVILLAGVGALAAFQIGVSRLDPPPLKLAEQLSVTVLDREGKLLRAFTAKDGKTSSALFKLDSDHSIRWMLGQGRAVVLRRDR